MSPHQCDHLLRTSRFLPVVSLSGRTLGNNIRAICRFSEMVRVCGELYQKQGSGRGSPRSFNKETDFAEQVKCLVALVAFVIVDIIMCVVSVYILSEKLCQYT